MSKVIAALLVGGGLILLLFGAVMIGILLFVPTQPEPDMNEGHGLAFGLGIPAFLMGAGMLAVGWVLDRDSEKVAAKEDSPP